jgi:8-oxo-dGTP diphosphatase
LELIFGTGNPGKLALMKEYLEGMDIELTDLSHLDHDLGEPEECGKTPLENAREKAEYYYEKLKRPVFSCDSGLLIEGLSTQEQPGVHVRVKDGIRMTDEQMTAYYSGIAHRLGGCCRARYQNAVCLILSETKRYEYDGEDIGGEAFYLVDRAKEQKEEGFPLDCISVDIKTGRYFVDEEYIPCFDGQRKGMREFFQRALEDYGAGRE